MISPNMHGFSNNYRWFNWPLCVLLSMQVNSIACQPTHSPTSATRPMTRKAKAPVSWLQSIRTADIAFVGDAYVTSDAPSTAAETGIRGGGYALVANITPTDILWGARTNDSYTIKGASKREPGHRLNIGESLFPPDALHQIPYWEYAQAEETLSVLVVGTNPSLVIPSPDTSLIEAIRTVKGWEKTSLTTDQPIILEQLSSHAHHPVAYVAAFDWLATDHPDIPSLFLTLCQQENTPSVAIQAILKRLSLSATRLSSTDVQALASTLLTCWHREARAEAISGYLDWFSAFKLQTWEKDTTLAQQVMTEVNRVKALEFQGVHGINWQQQIQYQASLFSQ